MIRRILVLGGGSAGLLAACSCKVLLPEVEVVVLQSSAIGIIKVGEATIPTVPLYLHDDLKLDLAEFYREVQPSWKLGIRFLWGRRPYFNYSFDPQTTTKFRNMPRASGYYCGDDFEYAGVQSAMMTLDRAFERQEGGGPKFIHNVAYHLENERLVGFLERYARRLGVTFHDGVVNQVAQNEQGVESLRLESGETMSADLFIDCSGFRSLLLGGALAEPYIDFSSSLFCDRAVVGGWQRGDEPIKPYTISETMDSGWCWQIDHPDRINRGYVYSSAYISESDAEAEFRRKNPKIESTFLVRFRSGRHVRGWVKNVVGVGNAAGFVEPLESTSLGEICSSSQGIARSLRDSQLAPGPAIRDAFNRRFSRSWDVIRRFLAIHYKFNNRLDTPFWQACVNDTNLAGGEEMVGYYQENGPSTIWRDALTDVYDQFNIEGWYTMLVGLQVPHHSRYVPSQAEWDTWHQIRQAVRRKAEAAMTSEEALRIIYSPAWKWNQSFYEGVPA